jgi:hypothetical protein
MAMRYTTQAIVCLAGDLAQVAQALQQKRVIEGDLAKTISGTRQIAATVHYHPNLNGLPNFFRTRDDGTGGFRLIIVGHGNPESTHIMGTNIQWGPSELSENVGRWVGGRTINRISLHMCFGGGNPLGRAAAPMPVPVERSFAMAFARVCEYTRSVTARTDLVNIEVLSTPQPGVPRDQWPVSSVHRTVGGQVKHRGVINKYVFERQAGGAVSYWASSPV